MTPRKLLLQSLYLSPDRAKLLDKLATDSGIPKASLLREAVDDLLEKNEKLGHESTLSVAAVVLTRAKEFAIAVSPQLRGTVWTNKVKEIKQDIDQATARLSAFQAGRSRTRS